MTDGGILEVLGPEAGSPGSDDSAAPTRLPLLPPRSSYTGHSFVYMANLGNNHRASVERTPSMSPLSLPKKTRHFNHHHAKMHQQQQQHQQVITFGNKSKVMTRVISSLPTKKRQNVVIVVLFMIVYFATYSLYAWTTITSTTITTLLTGPGFMRDYRLRNNTHWKNVQYDRGVFGPRLLRPEDRHIHQQCMQLAGLVYKVDDQPIFENSHDYNTNICFGPLPTNTTCCYCTYSRDDEPLGSFGVYKYWACAQARNHSLLPLDHPASKIDEAHGGQHHQHNHHQVAWVTGKFGHRGMFQADVDDFCRQVRDLNILDPNHIHCYWDSPDYVLQNYKFRRHLRYRIDPNDTSAKGGGFWFHKSVLLRHHLDLYRDGDYLVYTDIDRLDFFELGTFHGVLSTMAKREDDLAIEIIGNSVEGSYSKEDVLVAFNASKTTRESPQVLSNAIVLRNSPNMKRLIDVWVECMADWHMVTDEPSILPNRKEFLEHRHDQSILSLLIKRSMTVQAVVGPPARPMMLHGQINTYRFKEGEDHLTCPFPAFYASTNLTNVKNMR